MGKGFLSSKSQLLRHSLSKLHALSGERQGLSQWHAAETRVLRRRLDACKHQVAALLDGGAGRGNRTRLVTLEG